jgi:hypothetical protein
MTSADFSMRGGRYDDNVDCWCGCLARRGNGEMVKLSLCLTKHHGMKIYWGSGGIAPRILILGTGRR